MNAKAGKREIMQVTNFLTNLCQSVKLFLFIRLRAKRLFR